MQLPAHLMKKKKPAVAPEEEKKKQYSDTAVKMFATALDDLHMIKFKAGWFTMIKYEYEVFEKKNQALRDELVEFSKQTKMEKPETWLKDIVIRNKFLEKEREEKMAKQSQPLKKVMLRIGVGEEKEEEKESASKVVVPGGAAALVEGPPANTNTQSPVAALPPQPASVAKPKSQSKVALKRQRAAAQRAAAEAGQAPPQPMLQLALKKKMDLRLASAILDEDESNDPIPQPQAAAEPLQKPQIIEQPKQQPVQTQKPQQRLQPPARPALKLEQIEEEDKSEEVSKEKIQSSGLDLSGLSADQAEEKQKTVSNEFAEDQPQVGKHVSLQLQDTDKSVDEMPSTEQHEDKALTRLDSENIEIPFLDAHHSTVSLRQRVGEESSAKIQTPKAQIQSESTQFLFDKFAKLIRRRSFQKFKNFVKLQRQHEFKLKIEKRLAKGQTVRKMRYAFEQMKINSLSLEIQDKMQDKYQRYSRYVRRMMQVFSKTVAHSSAFQRQIKVKTAFKKWKDQTSTLAILEKKALEIAANRNQDFVSSYLIESINLSKDAINAIQNEEIVYVKEVRHDQQAVMKQTSQFYGLLLSKLDKMAQIQKIKAFSQIKIVSSDILSHSQAVIKKIRANMIYLKDVKQSLKSQNEMYNFRGSQMKAPKDLNAAGAETSVGGSYKATLEFEKGDLQRAQLDARKHNQTESKSFIIQANPGAQGIQSFQNTQNENRVAGNLYQSMISGSEYTNNYHQRPPKLHSIDDNSSLSSNFTYQKVRELKIDNLNQTKVEMTSQIPRPKDDKDDLYLFHIERQLNENLSLFKLFKQIQIQYIKQRNVISQDENFNEEEIGELTNNNKSKLRAISKIIAVEFSISNMSLHGSTDCKQLVRMFRLWKHQTLVSKRIYHQELLMSSEKSKMKCAFNILSLKFDNKKLIRNKFKIWHNQIIILKNKGWNPNIIGNYNRSLMNSKSMTGRAPRQMEQEREVLYKSYNISFLDQKVHQKMTSFMKINKLLIAQYISKGTILQKYIDNLKFLAQQQSIKAKKIKQLGEQGSGSYGYNQRGPFAAQNQSRQVQSEQKVIEENVNQIIEAIKKIIFNRWTLFTQHQIKHETEPKQQGSQRILAALDKMYQRNKMQALSKIHLYNLQIQSKQEINENADVVSKFNHEVQSSTQPLEKSKINQINQNQQINIKLQSNSLALFIIKNAVQQEDQKMCRKYFASWKFKTMLFEWRMSQSLVSMQSTINKGGSQNLQKIFEQLKEKNGAVTWENQQERRRHGVEIPPLVALKPHGLQIQLEDSLTGMTSTENKNFFDNYFTPKSAAIQQKLQKPWEIKQQRDKLKHISIYGGAIQAQNLLNRSFSDIDQNMKQLIFINSQRVDLAKAFQKWLKYAKSLKNKLRPREAQRLLAIMNKLQRNKLIKKFMLWKFSMNAKEAYPLQCELIDAQMIRAMSVVSVGLEHDVKNMKQRYKDLLKMKVLNKIYEVAKDENPVKEAFKAWKGRSCPIVPQMEELMHSTEEKDELKQQYDLLNQQNNEAKHNYQEEIQQMCNDPKEEGCSVCMAAQFQKLDEKTEIHYNQEHYQELKKLVGADGLRELLATPNHQEHAHNEELSHDVSSFKSSVMKFADQESEEINNEYGLNQDAPSQRGKQLNRRKTQTDMESNSQIDKGNGSISGAYGLGFNSNSHDKTDGTYAGHQANNSIEFLSSINQNDYRSREPESSTLLEKNPTESENSSQIFRGKSSFNQVHTVGSSTIQAASKRQEPIPAPGIITGAGGQADELAHMIEHENARLRAKHQQMREQLLQQQQQIEAEKQKHLEKIRKLKDLRDQEMDKYHRRLQQS